MKNSLMLGCFILSIGSLLLVQYYTKDTLAAIGVSLVVFGALMIEFDDDRRKIE